jgi:hypothetical protein
MTARPGGATVFVTRKEMRQLRADLDAFRLGLARDIATWEARGFARAAGHAKDLLRRVVETVGAVAS